MVKFFIVSSGYNCKWNIYNCFASIKNQTYPHFTAALISDGSRDNTAIKLRELNNKDERIKTYQSKENYGAAFQRYNAIKNYVGDDETVIVLLGLDDELKPDALAEIAKQYEQGKWMTYGNWVNQKGVGLPEDFSLEFDEATHLTRDYRKVKYRSTAPNTFKKFLFDKIPMSDFMVDGEWIKATTESEVMFSCLEMCGKERIGIIYKPIYIYKFIKQNNARTRMGADYQKRIYNTIINRPKKDLYVKSRDKAVA